MNEERLRELRFKKKLKPNEAYELYCYYREKQFDEISHMQDCIKAYWKSTLEKYWEIYSRSL
jgi:ribosomal protein L19E